jgi:threonylcarbamoyladenosine tRNA methylthiotransferase MtaB
LEGRTRAFLKIQDGCDYRCSFCTIPLARGRSRSQPLPDILCSIERLAERGIREVVLSGINLGDYGKGLPEPEAGQPCAYSFLEVVRAISLADLPVRRFRISSIEPNLLTDSIIQAVAQSPVFMPHFHIPLQSGSDTVLAEMRRRYRSGLYAERVASIRHAMPDAAIGVDVIVGFPGESEAEFQRTYDFLAALDVTYFHVFPYSERANTLAAELPSSVPQAVRYARCDALRALSEHKRRAFAARHAGQTRPVLWESQLQDDCLSGYTDNYIRVSRPATEADLAQWANTIELVTLTEVAPDGLVRLPEAVVGELVG